MTTQPLDLLPLADQLEAFIQESIPNASRVSKYGGTLFTLKPELKEGQFCGVFIYAAHVQVSISHGMQLDDPKKLLQGTGKTRRHINFKSINEVDFDALKYLLIQASEFQ
ncbi:DUF1801 domain-containing protein [Shewanella submarina]|uniref:DUF1801 domain-containing protein n=1 Tax=Shewanella submarina TaxID=2016376 RepID=A0ABV7GK68_9GAMM|nr:DUF1801 domain-containing protein [Shewanella submarina]MCL1035764.1 DUF1801 domain-containing protein [Shewanella submarina]